MNRDEVLGYWTSAIDNGTFLTNKHDPANISSPEPGFRTVTVLSQPELKTFLEYGEYAIREFQNNNPNHPPYYFEIVPADPSTVAGSGIQPQSTVPSTSCDVFIAVSGQYDGWHLFAEQSREVQRKQANGDITYLGEL